VAVALSSSQSAQIGWMEILETGIDELDAWHRKLINSCNDLLQTANRHDHWITVVAKAELLVANCLDHFRFEETIMRQSCFPRLDAHVAGHRLMEEQLRRVATEIRSADGSRPGQRALPLQFQAILIDAMVRHDLDYRSHLLHRLGR